MMTIAMGGCNGASDGAIRVWSRASGAHERTLRAMTEGDDSDGARDEDDESDENSEDDAGVENGQCPGRAGGRRLMSGRDGSK